MTRFGLRGRIAASLLVATIAAAAPPPVLAGAASQSVEQEALALAQSMQPRDLLMSLTLASMDETFVPALLETESGSFLEQQYPGILEAMHQAARGEVQASVSEMIPAAWAKLALVLADTFTIEEMQELRAFYATPTGQKVLGSLRASADIAPAIEGAAEDGAPGEPFDAEDIDVLLRIGSSRAGDKLSQIQPAIQQMMEDLSREGDPEFDARMDAAITAAMETFMGKAKSE